ncbi:MAG: ATP-binding protein, partial [Candidatus Altiarchaeota archaeon]
RLFQKKAHVIVLCGSSMRMMERLAGYKSPIYGRRTEQMLLTPLDFSDSVQFMGGIPLEKAVEFYATVGGTPAYLQLLDYKFGLEHNICSKILPKMEFLNQDAMFVLREELDEPRNYFSILKSLSKGNTQLGAIVNDTGQQRNLVAKYLSVLTDLHIVERRVPLTEKHGARSRKGIYQISDPYFRFWFRFVFDNLPYLEATNPRKTYLDRIKPTLNEHVASIFEDMCLRWLKTRKDFSEYAIGRWWKDSHEIDIIGLDETKNILLLVEVKWSNLTELDARRILDSLLTKAEHIDWQKKGRKIALGIIAKKIHSKDKLRKEGHHIFDIDDM